MRVSATSAPTSATTVTLATASGPASGRQRVAARQAVEAGEVEDGKVKDAKVESVHDGIVPRGQADNTGHSPQAPQAPPASDGPFYVVLNAGSGHNDTDLAQTTIARTLTAAGRTVEFLRTGQPAKLADLAQRAVGLALAHRGVVVAAGGDGTINTVARAVLASAERGHVVPFGVLPQGTFNYFGRVHGIPQEIEAAAQALAGASPQAVQVGLVNGQAFLVNASVGLYPQLLEDREAWKQRLGRSRVVAALSGLATLLRTHRQLHLQIDAPHPAASSAARGSEIVTPTLFVGNNPLQLERVGIDASDATAAGQGQLTAVVVRPTGSLALVWLMLRGLIGSLGDADNIDTFRLRRLRVMPRGRRRIKVATDGETAWLNTPLLFEISPTPLWLMVPSAQDKVPVE